MKPSVALLGALLLLLTPAVASAQTTLTLRAVTTDADGRITLGDLFTNAGAAAQVQVGTRTGPSAVLDAAAVQTLAARAGVYWDNPRGLRRIIVTQGPDGDGSAQPAQFTPGAPTQAQRPTQAGWPAAATPGSSGVAVIRREDTVAVTWSSGGLSLTMSGTAQRDAAVGDTIQVMNLSSKKLIDAVATGPGTAVAGQAADQFRSQMLLSSR